MARVTIDPIERATEVYRFWETEGMGSPNFDLCEICTDNLVDEEGTLDELKAYLGEKPHALDEGIVYMIVETGYAPDYNDHDYICANCNDQLTYADN